MSGNHCVHCRVSVYVLCEPSKDQPPPPINDYGNSCCTEISAVFFWTCFSRQRVLPFTQSLNQMLNKLKWSWITYFHNCHLNLVKCASVYYRHDRHSALQMLRSSLFLNCGQVSRRRSYFWWATKVKNKTNCIKRKDLSIIHSHSLNIERIFVQIYNIKSNVSSTSLFNTITF